MLEAYGLMRAGAHIKSFGMLEEWLKGRGYTPEDYRWLCERTASWDDPRYVTRLTEELVARLLVLKRTGEALDVVGRRLNLDPTFRPKSAADTLSIAQLAARGGGASASGPHPAVRTLPRASRAIPMRPRRRRSKIT